MCIQTLVINGVEGALISNCSASRSKVKPPTMPGSSVYCVAYQALCTQVSKLRDEVSRVLWSMGVYHADDAATSDGIFRADVALNGENVSLKQ